MVERRATEDAALRVWLAARMRRRVVEEAAWQEARAVLAQLDAPLRRHLQDADAHVAALSAVANGV
jgi:hypothetical protein